LVITDWRCVDRSADADCGCPEEFWERAGSPAVHMHLNAGKVSNGHADNGDWETEIEVKCETVDQARAAILGWASSLTAPPRQRDQLEPRDG
jgi:hypothetical protein